MACVMVIAEPLDIAGGPPMLSSHGSWRRKDEFDPRVAQLV